jgi:hypothetical protein
VNFVKIRGDQNSITELKPVFCISAKAICLPIILEPGLAFKVIFGPVLISEKT